MMTQLPGDSHPSTNAHLPRFSRRKPALVHHFLQTPAAKGPHPTLFLAPTIFTSLLDFEGQNLENRARPVLKPSWMWRGVCHLTKKKKKKERKKSQLSNRTHWSLSPDVKKHSHIRLGRIRRHEFNLFCREGFQEGGQHAFCRWV